MNRKTSRLSALCAFAWAFGSQSAFAVDIGPTSITTNSTWTKASSPYVIKGTVLINSGATLTIEPGVVVKFDGAHALTIAGGSSGTLRAIGTEQEPIIFTTNTASTVAASIRFESASIDATYDGAGTFTGGSILEHVTVERIGDPLVGGAIVLLDAHPFIHKSTIRNNGASGIRVYARLSGDLRIIGNTIEGNSASTGGGLHLLSEAAAPPAPPPSILLKDNVVLNNTATGQGGGLYLEIDGTATLTGNTFENNKAGLTGGGAMLLRADKSVSAAATLASNNYTSNTSGPNAGGLSMKDLVATLTSETISHNSSAIGGGLMLVNSQVSMTKSLITDNEATSSNGGGIATFGGNLNISHCVVALNRAPKYHGGGMDIHNTDAIVSVDHSVFAANVAKDYGSAISFSDGNSTVQNTSIVLNRQSSALSLFGQATVESSTIAYNQNDTAYRFSGSAIGIGTNAASSRIGGILPAQGNNFLGNGPYFDMLSDYAGAFPSEWNWWGGLASAAAIDARLAEGTNATFDFEPFSNVILTDNPVSPPGNVRRSASEGLIVVSWDPNPEPDVVRYKVYWGKGPFPEFENPPIEVTGTEYQFPTTLPGGNYIVAVTAVDDTYDANADVATTPVNENQTNGHESWFSAVVPVIVVEADLSVAVTPGTNNSNGVGNLVNTELMYFQVEVTNLGPSDAASDMTVTLSVTPGVTLGLPSGCTGSGTSITCTRTALALNESATIDIAATVGSANAMVIATATVSSPDDPDPMGTNNDAESTPICVNCPDLVVTWPSAPTVGTPSLTSESVVSVKNQGRVAASSVLLSISVPDGVSISTTPACSANGSALECNLATLAPGAQSDVGVSIVATSLGNKQITATASAAEIERSTTNNAVTVSTNFTEPADLAIAFTDNGATAAQKQLYGISVTNNGPTTANTVLVTVTLPAGLLAVSDNTQCAQADGTLICALGSLGVGASASLTFTTLYASDGSFELIAVVSADEFDPNTSNNSAKISTTVGSAGVDAGTTSGKKKGGGAVQPLLLAALAFWSIARTRRRSARVSH